LRKGLNTPELDATGCGWRRLRPEGRPAGRFDKQAEVYKKAATTCR
jgi:hypothetical protein